nr:hypothetical protein [Tanacetum cinerariifolium]
MDDCERIVAIAFVCVIFMFAGLAILDHNAEPVCYLMEAYDVYQLPMYTEEYQIKFYVRSLDAFNQKYPLGTPARAAIEDEISTRYVEKVQDDCRYELL